MKPTHSPASGSPTLGGRYITKKQQPTTNAETIGSYVERLPASLSGPTAFPARFVTKKQVAAYYACSTRQIEKLAASGVLPVRRMGRRMIRFDLARCEAALAKFDRAAIGEEGSK